jgi:hypothetical protein
VTNAIVALPSFAGEPGKIFDFNLTLPIIAAEFLLLMVILDKTVFGPVGKALDDRDKLIRDQLAAVGDNSSAVADLIVSVRIRVPPDTNPPKPTMRAPRASRARVDPRVSGGPIDRL